MIKPEFEIMQRMMCKGGVSYEVVPYHFDGIEVVSTNSVKHQATWFPPNEKHHNLAYNSFDVKCCDMNGKPPDYVSKQD